jgi:lysophospholipase L1-like esterase
VPGVRFRNCGVFGERTDQIARRIEGCARGADAVIIQGGINDIAQAYGRGRRAMSKTVERAARNIQSMVAQAKRLGATPLIANVLPWNNGHPVADPAVAKLSEDIAAIGRRERVAVLPFHSTLESHPGSGVMRSDLTIDGNHPSIAGYALLGEHAVAPALRRALR